MADEHLKIDDHLKETLREERPVRVFQPLNLQTFYANNSRIAMSYWDIRLYFLEALPETAASLAATGETGAKLVERFCVVMTPEYVRALAEGLTQAVKDYEETYTKLRPKPSEQQ